MRVWRISSFVYLSGKGGMFTSGRWHTIGRPVIYASVHPALAMVEFLVNVGDRALIKPGTVLFSIDISDDAKVDRPDPSVLEPGWQTNVHATRAFGDIWLDSTAALTLRVPTATGPSGDNFIVNPRHPNAAKLCVLDQFLPPFDDRLLSLK